MGIVASVAVGLVLLVAGASKIASRDRWPAEAEAMAAPKWVVPVVPWIEIVLGAAMTATVRRDITAWPAAALFVVFTGLIVANLARGRRPVCACFGALSARPLGWSHVARNAILIGLAVVAGVA
jgi:hypothetical protein